MVQTKLYIHYIVHTNQTLIGTIGTNTHNELIWWFKLTILKIENLRNLEFEKCQFFFDNSNMDHRFWQVLKRERLV